jgi:hypothetical protein
MDNLVIIKTKKVEKLKKILDKEKFHYEIYNNANEQDKKTEFLSRLAKLSPQEQKEIQKTEKILNSFNKARIKLSKEYVFLRQKETRTSK